MCNISLSAMNYARVSELESRLATQTLASGSKHISPAARLHMGSTNCSEDSGLILLMGSGVPCFALPVNAVKQLSKKRDAIHLKIISQPSANKSESKDIERWPDVITEHRCVYLEGISGLKYKGTQALHLHTPYAW